MSLNYWATVAIQRPKWLQQAEDLAGRGVCIFDVGQILTKQGHPELAVQFAIAALRSDAARAGRRRSMTDERGLGGLAAQVGLYRMW